MKKISVIIPVYNGERTIKKCLESLLMQKIDISNFEIIVVDDGSTDNTKDIINSFPNVRCFSQENGGPSKARNLGVMKSKYDYIAFTDADAYVDINRLTNIVKTFSDESIMIFGGKIENSNNTFFAHINHLLAFSDFYGNTKEKVRMIPSGNLSFRKEVFNKLGGFNEDFKIGAEDTDLSFNAKKRGYNIYYIPDIIINHDTTNNFLLFAKKQFKYGYISYKCRLKYPEYNIQFIFNKFLFPFLIPLLVLRNIIMLFTSKYFYKHFFYSVLGLPLLIVFKFIYWIGIGEHFYKKN